jgi:hypothetical protein
MGLVVVVLLVLLWVVVVVVVGGVAEDVWEMAAIYRFEQKRLERVRQGEGWLKTGAQLKPQNKSDRRHEIGLRGSGSGHVDGVVYQLVVLMALGNYRL